MEKRSPISYGLSFRRTEVLNFFGGRVQLLGYGMQLKRRLFAWLCAPMMMKNRSMLIPKIDMQLPAAICSANECFGDAGLEGNLS